MSFFKKTLFGLSWMAGLRAVTRSLAVVKVAILARLLLPSQFGVYGIATLALAFLEIITETGINIFLIQEKSKIDEYLNSAWVVSILRGILISLILILVAPCLAVFFNSPNSILILRLISLVAFIRGFVNPAVVRYQKDLQFNKKFFFDSSLFLIDTVFAIILTFITKSENSLVWAMIISAIVEVILSFTVISPRPKLILDISKVKKVINRGKWITGAGIFNYLFQNLDDILVGKILGTNLLGIYQQAYKISTIPVSEVGEIFNKVTLPIYATISEDRKRLKKAFIKTLLTICFFVIPFGIIVFLFPDFIVKIILGDRWLSAIPVLKILAIFGVVKAIFNSFFSLFLSIGKQEIVMLITFISICVMAIVIYPLIMSFGIIGAAYATIIATLISFPFTIYFWNKFLNEN